MRIYGERPPAEWQPTPVYFVPNEICILFEFYEPKFQFERIDLSPLKGLFGEIPSDQFQQVAAEQLQNSAKVVFDFHNPDRAAAEQAEQPRLSAFPAVHVLVKKQLPEAYAFFNEKGQSEFLSRIQEAQNNLGKNQFELSRSRVLSVSPNWYSGGAPYGIVGGGGPGEPPVEPNPDPDPTEQNKLPFSFPKMNLPLSNSSDVDVFILDAFPDDQANSIPDSFPQDHPLRSLFNSGKLHWYPRTDSVLAPQADGSGGIPAVLGNIRDGKHDYPLHDHGVFITGIIHSLVPDAQLHLIPILNDYAAGTMYSFAEGLQLVHALAKDQRDHHAPGTYHFIVNLSIIFSTPVLAILEKIENVAIQFAEWFFGDPHASPDDVLKAVAQLVNTSLQGLALTFNMVTTASDAQGGQQPEEGAPPQIHRSDSSSRQRATSDSPGRIVPHRHIRRMMLQC